MNRDVINLLKLALLAFCALAVIGGTFYLWTGGHKLIATSVLVVGVIVFLFWLKWFKKGDTKA